MMNYNYREAMAEDIKNGIVDYLDYNDTVLPEDVDDAFETLYDEFWIDDAITGNGSGSYTFNSAQAKEYVTDNMDDCLDAIREFCIEPEQNAEHFLNEDWEWFDVTIRCYLLGEVLRDVLEEMYMDKRYGVTE